MKPRPAVWAVVVVPAAVSIGLFAWTATRSTASGAGMSDDNRPIGFFMLAAFGAAGWMLGTAAMFIVIRPPDRLPRGVRMLAAQVVHGTAAVAAINANASLPAGRQTLPSLQLLVLALVMLPLLTFLAPMLMGWLLQPGVYRPAEYVAVVAMGIAVVLWTSWLVLKALR